MDRRAHLSTESSNPTSAELDRLSVAEAFDVFDQEEFNVAPAVSAARAEIVAAIELVVHALERGGRLLYVGAGTSGRLGLLDAVECPPTFQSDPERVQARLAGGDSAFLRSLEGAEDDAEAGAQAVADGRPEDVVFGIAAGGTTPFVHGAIARAKQLGCASVFLACVPFESVPDAADVSIRLATGPEVLTGSTRLKAGTATKMVLNRITTIAMARLGKVHGNLMVDVNSRGNAKLTERGARMLASIAGIDFESAGQWLERADGSVKMGCVMQRFDCSLEQAETRLAAAGGFLRAALAGD